MNNHSLPVIPAAFFGIVLGIAGLGNAWRIAHRVWGAPALIGEFILLLASLIWLILLILYVGKWIYQLEVAKAELRHPIQCCFVGLIGVTTMLIAGAALPYSRSSADVLFIAGMLYTILFAAWRTGGLWEGGREIKCTTAVLYLPTVAGFFVTANGAAAMGYAAWGQLAFGAGLFSWLSLESVLINRLFVADALPTLLRPTLGIQLAPPTVGALSYLNLTSGVPDFFSDALIGYGLLQCLVLIRLLPWIRAQPFTPSYWGFSFGVASLGAAPIRMIERGDHGPISMLAPYLFIAANIVILLLAIATLKLLFSGLFHRKIPAHGSSPAS